MSWSFAGFIPSTAPCTVWDTKQQFQSNRALALNFVRPCTCSPISVLSSAVDPSPQREKFSFTRHGKLERKKGCRKEPCAMYSLSSRIERPPNHTSVGPSIRWRHWIHKLLITKRYVVRGRRLQRPRRIRGQGRRNTLLRRLLCLVLLSLYYLILGPNMVFLDLKKCYICHAKKYEVILLRVVLWRKG